MSHSKLGMRKTRSPGRANASKCRGSANLEKSRQSPDDNDEAGSLTLRIQWHTMELARLAEKGNEVAALEIFRIAGSATNTLNKLARARPDLFIPIAARRTCWPLLWSPHPEAMGEDKAFAQYLTLGSQTGLNLSQRGKTFSTKVPANEIAFHLLRLAQALRRAPIKDWDREDELPLLHVLLRFDAGDLVLPDAKQLRDLEGWRQREGKKLPPLSRVTVGKWKPAVRELFRLVIGEKFDEHPQLLPLRA